MIEVEFAYSIEEVSSRCSKSGGLRLGVYGECEINADCDAKHEQDSTGENEE